MNIPSLPLPSHPSHSVMDSTKIQSFQTCPRMFFYEYILGWRRSTPSNHLVFGKAVHKALEHIILNGYNTQSLIDAMEIFTEEYRSVLPESTDEIFSPKTPARFFDMLIEYVKKYSDDDLKYEVIKTEFGGTVKLSEEHEITFKMDTILRNREFGTYFSREHKTKGGNYIPPSYPYEHMLGIQVGTYTHVLNCLFNPQETSGVELNVLCFKKTKVASFIFERFPIQLSNNQMYNWLETVLTWLDLIHYNYNLLSTESDKSPVMKSFPMNSRNCTKWARICPYFGLCEVNLNPLQSLDRIPADMEIDFWNPLEEDLRETMNL